MDVFAVQPGNPPDESLGLTERATPLIRLSPASLQLVQQAVNQPVQLRQTAQGPEQALRIQIVLPQTGSSVQASLPVAMSALFESTSAVSGVVTQDGDGRIVIALAEPKLKLPLISQPRLETQDLGRAPLVSMPSQLAAISQINSKTAEMVLSSLDAATRPLSGPNPGIKEPILMAAQAVLSGVRSRGVSEALIQPNTSRIASQILNLALDTGNKASVVQQPTVHAHPSMQTLSPARASVAAPQPIGYSLIRGESAVLLESFAQSIARAMESLGGTRPMLIPDVSPAIPRPIAPDALPSQMPIRQSVAQELGLKVGQVVQALVASSGDKMGLQLGSRQLPLPPGVQLPEGPIALRVVQTAQGMALAPQVATQLAGQTAQAGVSGLSAALLTVLSKQGQRGQIQTLLQPGQLEAALGRVGLGAEAQRLSAQRLPSDRLTGEVIRQAIQFGGLANEKAIAEGVAMNGGLLKPWLRQILRLLPQQSELVGRLSGLLAEIEHFQLESLPQSQTRDSGLSALLLFRDQPPVELQFERQTVADEEGIERRLWVINLHTELSHLGEVWMKSSFDQQTVDLTLWARESATAKLATAGKYDLQEALSEHGLTVKSMQIFDQPRPDHRMMDEHGTHMEVKA
jgi:hypothetical protein